MNMQKPHFFKKTYPLSSQMCHCSHIIFHCDDASPGSENILVIFLASIPHLRAPGITYVLCVHSFRRGENIYFK